MLIAWRWNPCINVGCHFTISISEKFHALFSHFSVFLWRTCIVKHVCNHLLSDFVLINLWIIFLVNVWLRTYFLYSTRSGSSCNKVKSICVKKLMSLKSFMHVSRVIPSWLLSSNQSENISQKTHYFWHIKLTFS